MIRRPQKPPKFDRPKQECPADLVAGLMEFVRRKFYPAYPSDPAVKKQWFQDQGFLKTRVVLWPAGWLNERGVTLSPNRYREILCKVLTEAAIHGTTAKIQYYPAYLAKCVQSHFKIHEDEIYVEAKTVRTALDRAVLALGRIKAEAPPVDAVLAMAEARQAILQNRRTRKTETLPPPKAKTGQLDLF